MICSNAFCAVDVSASKSLLKQRCLTYGADITMGAAASERASVWSNRSQPARGGHRPTRNERATAAEVVEVHHHRAPTVTPLVGKRQR